MNKQKVSVGVSSAQVKAFSIVIEPMYVGRGKDKRMEKVISVRVYDPVKEGINELQGIVPPNSILDLEVKELLKFCKESVKKA
jgi:hypothetical protein